MPSLAHQGFGRRTVVVVAQQLSVTGTAATIDTLILPVYGNYRTSYDRRNTGGAFFTPPRMNVVAFEGSNEVEDP